MQSIWKSTNNDGLFYEVTEFINVDEIISKLDGVDGDRLYYTLSGTSGFADILLRATSSDGCESDVFAYIIEVDSGGNDGGGGNNTGTSTTTTGGGNNTCPELISENGFPPYEGTPEVDSLEIKLDDFFTDLDGDQLTYTAEFYGSANSELVEANIDSGSLFLVFNGSIGDGYLEITASDGQCEAYAGFEIRILQSVVDGCPQLLQGSIEIPVSPVETQLWFPLEFIFDTSTTGPLSFDSISIVDSSFSQVSLGEEDGQKVIYFDLPKDGSEGVTSFDVTVTTSDGGCGEVYTVSLLTYFDQEFYEIVQNNNGGGSDGGGDSDDNGCPAFEIAVEQNALIYDLGSGTASIDLSGAIQELNINPSEAEVTFEVVDELGGAVVEYSIDASNQFNITIPENNYFLVIDIFYYKDGECLGEIAIDITNDINNLPDDGPDGGGPDGGGPDGGGPDGGGPDNGPNDGCIVDVPYPGDEGWCGADTPILFIDGYAYEDIVTNDLRSITISNPILDESGVYIETVYSTDHCVAQIAGFDSSSKTIEIGFGGGQGSTVIVVELRKEGSTDSSECPAVIAFYVDVNQNQGGGGGPGTGPGTDPVDPSGEGDNTGGNLMDNCEWGDVLSPIILDPSATSATRDLSAEIAALGLPDDYEIHFSGFASDLGTEATPQVNFGSVDTAGIWSISLPGIEIFVHVDIMFFEPNTTNCIGNIHFDIEASNGDFGGGGDIGVPGGNIPVDPDNGSTDSGASGSPGDAPFPGDEGFCSSQTEVIQLDDVISTTSENTVTTSIDHPLLSEPGVSIANVFTNDSSIATIKDFFPQNNSVILELTGQPGGVAIVFEIRKASQLAPEDCAAVMFFVLGVIDPSEIDCQITNSYDPIFVIPGTVNVDIDLNPFFESFGGFEAYSQSFKLDLVDPFLTVGVASLDGTALTIDFNGQEGFDMLIFQNSDLNGNCINLIEVPVIVDPNAASVNPDEGGIGSGTDDGPNLNCEIFIDYNEGITLMFEPGVSPVSVPLASAFAQLEVDPSDVQIEAYIQGEIGGTPGPWVIDSSNSFNIEPPTGDYLIIIELYIKNTSTGECLGTIVFDIGAFDTSAACIETNIDTEATENEATWFTPGETFQQDLSQFFFSTQGNELVIEVDSNDLITLNDLGGGIIEFNVGEQTGEGIILISVTDLVGDCEITIQVPFFIDPTPPVGQGPPPDFSCPQYIEDIMPLYASNADPREYMIDLNNFFYIPPTGINYTLVLPPEWGADTDGDGIFIEKFADITLDDSFLKINTDNRTGEAMFQVQYESAASSTGSCTTSLIDLMVSVSDELGNIQAELQENCNQSDFILNNEDFAALSLELGVQDDIKVELRDLLVNPAATGVDFYVRYDLIYPEPPSSNDSSSNSQPDMNIPLVDGFISGDSELIVFAPRFEAGNGEIPIEVYDNETGCNFNFTVLINVIDSLGIADIDCPQPIMDFAEFTISQDGTLDLNLADFFAVSGDASSTAQFYYEFGSDRPEKVQLELIEAENKLVITPSSDPEALGDVFVFIKAGDSNEYCEAFADIMLRILPSGVTENECPFIYSEYLNEPFQFPSDQTSATIYLSEWITDDGGNGTLDWQVHMNNNSQLDYSLDQDGIMTLYLKEFMPGDVTFYVDAIDSFGCVITEGFVVRLGESSPEFAFNRCPQITEAGATSLATMLVQQGVVDGSISSDLSFINIPLTGIYTDLDGDTITYDAFSHDPSIASVEVVSNTLTIFFLPQKYGNVQFEFFARDGDPFCDPGQALNISRTPPANIAPVVICPEIISQIPPIEVAQGSALDVIPLNQLFADVSASSFDFYAVSENSGIVEAKIDGDKLILEYSSSIDGSTNVTVVSSNVSGTCDVDLNFTVTVVPPAVNLSPVFEPQSVTILENDAEETSAAIAKFASRINVFDPEGASVTLTISAGNDEGLFELRNNGNVGNTIDSGYELFVIGKLDYEDKTFHELELTASDGEKTSTYLYRVNVGDIQNASINADFNLSVFDQDNESETTSGTTGKNQAYKRFTNPRFRNQMEVGKWKVRKKITGGADAALFEINQEADAGGPEIRGSVNMIDVLDFRIPPDFENPQDHNKDNVYEVTVELINEDDGESEIPVIVNQKEISVPENDAKTVEIQSIGASPAQDTDGDGVADVIDNSPLFANANQADADGDGVGDVTDDDDQDGVWNPNDGCANTTLGDRVDIYGCAIFYLPTNNFSITKSEKCVGANSISIATARADLNYSVSVSGAISQTTSFSGSTYDIENLSAGTYSVCLTVDGVASSVYQRCYSMTITEPQPLSVFSITDPGNNSVTFNLDGGTVYNVTHNGMTTQTKESTYTISLKAGMNTIDINTGIGCQGEFGTTYFNSSPVDLAPNPFKSSVKLYIGGEDEAISVSVFNMTGNQVVRVDKVLEFGSRTLEINTTSLMAGTYLIKINGATTQQTFVAIKQ